MHKEGYRDENEQITYGRWQTDTAGGSGKAAVRGNEKRRWDGILGCVILVESPKGQQGLEMRINK